MAEYIKRDSIIGLAHKMQFGRILTEREVEVIEMVVNDVPAADVAPVRHGRWGFAIEGRNRFTCSVCGWSKRTDSHVGLGYLGYNYCPNCGAKMDGGVNNE